MQPCRSFWLHILRLWYIHEFSAFITIQQRCMEIQVCFSKLWKFVSFLKLSIHISLHKLTDLTGNGAFVCVCVCPYDLSGDRCWLQKSIKLWLWGYSLGCFLILKSLVWFWQVVKINWIFSHGRVGEKNAWGEFVVLLVNLEDFQIYSWIFKLFRQHLTLTEISPWVRFEEECFISVYFFP